MKATLDDLVNALTKHMSAVDMTQTALHIEISRLIRNTRRGLKMSQKEMADKMGVRQSLISRWESGECNYTLDTLVEIADALGLSVQCPLVPNSVQLSASTVNVEPISDKVANQKATFSTAIRFDLKNVDRFDETIKEAV